MVRPAPPATRFSEYRRFTSGANQFERPGGCGRPLLQHLLYFTQPSIPEHSPRQPVGKTVFTLCATSPESPCEVGIIQRRRPKLGEWASPKSGEWATPSEESGGSCGLPHSLAGSGHSGRWNAAENSPVVVTILLIFVGRRSPATESRGGGGWYAALEDLHTLTNSDKM